jgi:hypothetical protein
LIFNKRMSERNEDNVIDESSNSSRNIKNSYK